MPEKGYSVALKIASHMQIYRYIAPSKHTSVYFAASSKFYPSLICGFCYGRINTQKTARSGIVATHLVKRVLERSQMKRR